VCNTISISDAVLQWPKDSKEVIKRKWKNNDLQNITQKTKDGARRIPKRGPF
jgi:hypothetical protein